jgi:hypothetical protein
MRKIINTASDVVWDYITFKRARTKGEFILGMMGYGCYAPMMVYVTVLSLIGILHGNYPFYIKVEWMSLPIMSIVIVASFFGVMQNYNEFKKGDKNETNKGIL